MSDHFTLDISRWIEKAKSNADEIVRAVGVQLTRSIIDMSPVGNPELWKVNQIATEYNAEVAAHNTILRNDPSNLDKRGYLKAGLQFHDGMNIKAPPGYVGGRFRRNWRVSIGEPDNDIIDGIDPTGQQAIADANAALAIVKAGQPIYIYNNLPYAHRLEFEGWSQQAPLGMVRVTVARFQAIVADMAAQLPK